MITSPFWQNKFLLKISSKNQRKIGLKLKFRLLKKKHVKKLLFRMNINYVFMINITKFINKINIIRRIFVQDFNRSFF